jgi:hypothetical protein
MPEYTFTTLSPKEFETLSRDLLQVELGIRFETFTAGRDDGIDARWSNGLTDTIIIQCKHFAGSGYRKLLRTLKEEKSKIKVQQNLRYILTTSVGLTPANKDEILKTLHPYCCSTSDIYGRDDLNNLLSLHPQIEQQNFKLWLTSEAVLSRMLNAGILNDSASALDKARKRVQRYVQNNSFQRAVKLIEERRVCIIAGIPGIGKTTLAEVLLTYYVDKHDYNAFCISEDISDIKSIKQRDKKQIFYYDDFLGTITLDPLRKNEDKRIVDFIEEVCSNKNWIFILTTREYILQNAKSQYESLSQFPLDLSICTISLDDYTTTVKAEILYNHIYFSDMPTDYKVSILNDKNYEKILNHENYNPRIIDHMTSFIRLSETSSNTYVDVFILNLDNPKDIWKHAFERQINSASRHLLLVLVTLPEMTSLEDVKTAFWAFHRYRHQLHGFSTNSLDFNDSVKLLDGNFIRIFQIGSKIKTIRFHNPSVRDFLQTYLLDSESDICDLVTSSIYFEQLEIIWTGHSQYKLDREIKITPPLFSWISRNYPAFLNSLQRTIYERSCKIVSKPSFEERIVFILKVTSEYQIPLSNEINIPIIKKLISNLQNPTYNTDKLELIKIIYKLESIDFYGEESIREIYQLTRNILIAEPCDFYDFRALESFFMTFREDFSQAEIEEIQSKFKKFCVDEVKHRICNNYGIEELQGFARRVKEMAESFEMFAPNCIRKIYKKIQKLDYENDISDNNEKERIKNLKEENTVTTDRATALLETGSMFNRLLSDLDLVDSEQLTESIDFKL